MKTIILDGYNVILRSPAFRPDERRDLKASREKLVNLLSWALGGTGQVEFIVVFDGADVAPAQRKTVKSGGSSKVTIHFSKPPAKADDLIRDLVNELAPRGDVTVVTSDLEVARHARGEGAAIVLSDLFAASLFKERAEEQLNEAVARGKKMHKRTGSPTSEGSDAEKKQEGVSKKNAEAWLKLFEQQQKDQEENDF